MTERITIYYDYTCPYSYRAFRWLQQLQQTGSALDLAWRTFSLKEANRGVDEPSLLAHGPVPSISILALELAKAAQAAGSAVFARYHETVFAAMHDAGRRLTADDLLVIARKAGLDVARFQADRAAGVWLDAVTRDHREGVGRWRVFGTPTLVFQDAAVYLKLAEAPPSPRAAAEVFAALRCLTRCHPELIEIKRPQAGS